MSLWTALCLYSWTQLALGQNIPEAVPPLFIPDCEGDVLFLTDSSGSVSYYEFSKVKDFVINLLRPFTFGPQDVQTSVIHISTVPALEFPFDQHTSREAVQEAIQDMEQRMGDTNTGLALAFAKDKLFTDQAGARAGVPKVLVWVTDGISTDDVSEPMKLLKDMGITVFIVSTGRGNYLELSEAASQPPEEHLLFVDVDDLSIITKELRDSIIEVIRARRLKATDVTSSSFRLTWPRLLSSGAGYYVVEYAFLTEPRRKLRMNVAGDQTGVMVSNLAPGTSYNVTLIPESNEQYIRPQNIQVTTLEEVIWEPRFKVMDVTSSSFRLTWERFLPSGTGYYMVEYTPVTDPRRKLRMNVAGDQTEVFVSNLAPGTSYTVTIIPEFKEKYVHPQNIQVTTLEEVIWVPRLKVMDVTSSSFQLTWERLLSIGTGYYVVEYMPVTDPRRKMRINVAGDKTGVLVSNLAPGISYNVTIIPEFNEKYVRPQHIQVTTLEEVIWVPRLKVMDVTSSSFRLMWEQLPSSGTGYYVMEYTPVTDPRRKMRINVAGDKTGVLVSNLAPGITYNVTIIPEFSDKYVRPQHIQVTTLEEVIWVPRLKVMDVTYSSFRLTWELLPSSGTGYYVVEYTPVTDPRRKTRITVAGDKTGVLVSNLAPGISYNVTIIPEFNEKYVRPQHIQVTTLEEVIWVPRLKVMDVTSSSFRLTWERLPSSGTGYYVVEYTPVTDPRRKTRITVAGDKTGVLVSNLAPGITYNVTIIPEFNEKYVRPQHIQVTTLEEVTWAGRLKVMDVTSSSFRVMWEQLPSSGTGYYVVEYTPVSDPRRKMRITVAGDKTGVLVSNLAPGITYNVTIIPEFNDQHVRPQHIQVTTLEEVIWVPRLKVMDVTSSSFRLTWERLPSSGTGYYVVEYTPVTDPRRKTRITVAGDKTGVLVSNLAPGISYNVTIIPEFNEKYVRPQHIQVTTLEEVVWPPMLKAMDVTSSSFQLMWARFPSSSTGYYLVECTSVADPRQKLTMTAAGDQTGVLVRDLLPGTTYNVALIPEFNEEYVRPQNIQVTTLEDQISPSQILISESSSHSFQVSWSPTPDSVAGYQILYGPLPGNSVKLLEVDGSQNSTIVDNLLPNTTYLVTVSALYKSGKEKALSAKACTEEENSRVRHLRFQDVGENSLKATWDSADGEVLGYRVRCRRQAGPSSLLSVAPQTTSVLLTGLATGTSNKLCVKPVYRNKAGRGLCKMARVQPATSAPGYRILQPA